MICVERLIEDIDPTNSGTPCGSALAIQQLSTFVFRKLVDGSLKKERSLGSHEEVPSNFGSFRPMFLANFGGPSKSTWHRHEDLTQYFVLQLPKTKIVNLRDCYIYIKLPIPNVIFNFYIHVATSSHLPANTSWNNIPIYKHIHFASLSSRSHEDAIRNLTF